MKATEEPVSPPAQPLRSFDEPEGPGYERHIVELDGIRGVAALAVVFHHIAQHTIAYEHGVARVLLFLCQLGFLGVDVFFALSGFLITRILLRKRESAHYYRNFYARRLLRLAPPYLLTLAIVASVVPGSRSYLLLSLFYLANVSDLFHVPLSYGVLWSLSVEEHFYFLWPWLTRLLTPRRLAGLCIVICVLTPVGRLMAIHRHVLYTDYSWYRFDGLAWGALLALCLQGAWMESRALKTAWKLLAAGGCATFLLASALFVTFHFGTAYSVYYTAVPMLTTALIACAVRGKRPSLRVLRSRALRFFGDISYWLYLIHYLFVLQLELWLKQSHPAFLYRGGLPLWLFMSAGVLLPSIVTGMVVRRYIELPMLRRKALFS